MSIRNKGPWSVVFAASLFSASSAWAVPENELLARAHSEIIENFRYLQPATLVGQRNLAIRYFSREVQGATQALVIVPGRTESTLKYAELLYDFRDLPFSIYVIDHRGQGFSDREKRAEHDPVLGYVEHFDDYVKDLAQLMNEVVLPKGYSRHLLLAHSMGGAIAAKYLAQYPGVFERAVLSSPMLQVNTAPFPEAIAQPFSGLLTGIGQGAKYAPGRKADEWARPFEQNDLTKSEARYEFSQQLMRRYPQTIVGGPSSRWVSQSLRATDQIKRLKEDSVRIPILLFQAEADRIVKPKGQDVFCAKMSGCRKVVFMESEHEILQERDSIRDMAMRMIRDFFGR